MNKCSFCKHSYNDNGLIKCPHQICKLTQDDIINIMYRVGSAWLGNPTIVPQKGNANGYE